MVNIRLVPQATPSFQCCMLKSGRAWYAKSRESHKHIIDNEHGRLKPRANMKSSNNSNEV